MADPIYSNWMNSPGIGIRPNQDILSFLVGARKQLNQQPLDVERELGLGGQGIERELGLGQLELGRGAQGLQREQMRETGRQFDVKSALDRLLLDRQRESELTRYAEQMAAQAGQQINLPRTTRTIFRGGMPVEEDFNPFLNYLTTRYGKVPTPKNPK